MAIDLSSSLVTDEPEEDLDPMSSVANLVDVMLVFACGLMMAVVLAWNVDVSSVVEAQPAEKLTEVDDIQDLDSQLITEDGSAYINRGSVYQDPNTGKYYMVMEDDGSEDSGGQASSGSSE